MPVVNVKQKYHAYDQLIESGLEWLGQIPASWQILPVRGVLSERVEKNRKLEYDNILSVMRNVGVIRYADKGDIGNKSSDRPEAYKIVKKNDIVLNSMNLSIGSVGISREDGVTSSVYIIYYAKPKIATTDFFHYLFETTQFQRHLASYGKGIMELREAVKEISIRNQLIAVPNIKEQYQIAQYLDEKVILINKIIAEKQKLIHLLQEKRSALITHAVTKGLDPKAKMKPSGIDWIGEIPEDWTIEKIKHVVKERRAKTDKFLNNNYIALENIESFTGKFIGSSEKLEPESSVNIFQKGDVLFSKLRPYLAKAHHATIDGVSSGEFIVMIPTKKIISDYLLYSLLNKEFIDSVNNLTYGTKMPRANWQLIGGLQIVFPNREKQQEITEFIKQTTSKIDDVIVKIKKQVEKLTEYRASLIYHAVTGKIKV